MNAIIKRFRQYPPALQLLLGVLALVVMAMIWHDLIWAVSKQLDERTAEYVAAVEQSKLRGSAVTADIERVVLLHGEIQPPRPANTGAAEVTRVVDEIVRRHPVTELVQEMKQRTRFPRGELESLVPARNQPERLGVEVRFTSRPDVAYAVIAELESSSVIESVKDVSMNRVTDARRREVAVTINLEAWVYSPATVPGAGGIRR